MSDCSVYQELISRMVDDELSEPEREDLQRHMDGCEQCRSLWSVFSGVSEALSSELEEAPEGLRENVMAQLRRDDIKKKNTARLSKPVRNILAAAACMVLLVGAAMGIGSRLNMSESAAMDMVSGAAAQSYSQTVGEADMASRDMAQEAAPAAQAPDSGESEGLDEEAASGMDSLDGSESLVAAQPEANGLETQKALNLDWSSLSGLLGGQSSQLSLEELSPYLYRVFSLKEEGLVYIYQYQDEIYYYSDVSGEILKAACSLGQLEDDIIAKHLQ